MLGCWGAGVREHPLLEGGQLAEALLTDPAAAAAAQEVVLGQPNNTNNNNNNNNHVYIYIYIYIEREREIMCIDVYACV